jgi:hypothetical protein
MSEQLIDAVTGENASLELHTELCAQRYQQIIAKFDEIDQRLVHIANTMQDIRDLVTTTRTTQLETYLKWAGAIIMATSGVITALFMHWATR